jgi:hypothetical protein
MTRPARGLLAALPLLALLLVTLLLGGCGSPDSSAGVASAAGRSGAGTTTPAPSLSPQEKALKFAQCMREHGVDMPDPQTTKDGGGMVIGGPGMSKVAKPTMERAQRACQKILESVKPPELSDEEEQKLKERALKFAQCMREQGIDFPDPQFQSGGGMTQRFEGGQGPDDPRFRDASEKCSKYEPRGPRFRSAK